MKYRMYHLVMYNISPIQQGIQAYHAGMEYAKKYFNDEDFQKWLKEEKTVIILNGGTSNNGNGIYEKGSINLYKEELYENDIKHSCFREPDLNDALSAIAFLVPEQVWDKENYVDWEKYQSGEIVSWEKYQSGEIVSMDINYSYDDWVKEMGGEKNVWLREFLSQFRLA